MHPAMTVLRVPYVEVGPEEHRFLPPAQYGEVVIVTGDPTNEGSLMVLTRFGYAIMPDYVLEVCMAQGNAFDIIEKVTAQPC